MENPFFSLYEGYIHCKFRSGGSAALRPMWCWSVLPLSWTNCSSRTMWAWFLLHWWIPHCHSGNNILSISHVNQWDSYRAQWSNYFLSYRLAPGMATYAPWVITVQLAPDTLMSTPVLLEPGVMHWGPRLCLPVGSALLDTSATALVSFSPPEYVLQVQIHNLISQSLHIIDFSF